MCKKARDNLKHFSLFVREKKDKKWNKIKQSSLYIGIRFLEDQMHKFYIVNTLNRIKLSFRSIDIHWELGQQVNMHMHYKVTSTVTGEATRTETWTSSAACTSDPGYCNAYSL